MTNTEEQKTTEVGDPEPFAIFLGVLGALGSVASIASYAEYRRLTRKSYDDNRHKNLLRARDLLKTIDTDLLQIRASLQKLEMVLIEGVSEHHVNPPSDMQLKFGTCKPLFTYKGFRKYREIMMETNRLVGQMLEAVTQLLQCLYDVEVKINQKTYQELLELQSALNTVIVERRTYQEGFRTYYELIQFTQRIVKDVRGILTEAMKQ